MRSEPTTASLLLVHGAGSGPWVFDDWPAAFPELEVAAADLQEGLDVSRASMHDYARRVVARAERLPRPFALCGWSMGGLVALLATDDVKPESVVLIEASAPGEVQGFAADAELVEGVFDPEEVYGPFPPGIRARGESQLARGERKRGLSVPSLRCRSLVVYGSAFPEERGTHLAALYGSQEAAFPELGHWELVRSAEVRAAIRAFLLAGAVPPRT